MGKLEIGPTEKRDVHLKTYIEKSVEDAVKGHQENEEMFSVSEAARDLIIVGLEHLYG